MSITMQRVGSAPHHDLLVAEADDILIVLPEEGFKDTAETSRVTVSALQEYARKLSKKCGLIIVANNLMAQDAESRRVYADGITPDLFFGVTLVVSSPVARIIGNLALRLSTMQVPLNVVENIDGGVAWLKANRKV